MNERTSPANNDLLLAIGLCFAGAMAALVGHGQSWLPYALLLLTFLLMFRWIDKIFILFILSMIIYSRDFAHVHFSGVYVTEALMVCVFAVLSIKFMLKGSARIPAYPLKHLFFAWYTWAGIAFVYGMFMYQDSIFVVRQSAIVYYSLFYFLVPLVFNDLKKIRHLFASFLICCLCVSAALFFGIHFTIMNMNFGEFSYYYVSFAAIFLMIYLMLYSRYVVFSVLLLFLFSFAVSSGMARSVWVGLFGVVVFVALLSTRYTVFRQLMAKSVMYGVPIVLFLIGGVSVFKPQLIKDVVPVMQSIVHFSEGSSSKQLNAQWRLYVWKDILVETMERPMMGWGFGKKFIPETIRNLNWGGSWKDPDKLFQDPHNSYLSILYRTGSVGLVLFLLIIVLFIARTVSYLRTISDPEIAFYVLSLILCMTFILGASNFMVLLEGPFLGIFLWISMGLIVSLVNIDAQKVYSAHAKMEEVLS